MFAFDEIKKGKMIENICYQCGNKKMKVTRISDPQKAGAIIWCECKKCGAIDDIVIYFDDV